MKILDYKSADFWRELNSACKPDSENPQIASAVDIIIHLSRLRDKSRKTMEITEVVGYENGKIILNPLYVFEEDEKSTLEKVSGKLKRTDNKMQNTFKLKLSGFKSEIWGDCIGKEK